MNQNLSLDKSSTASLPIAYRVSNQIIHTLLYTYVIPMSTRFGFLQRFVKNNDTDENNIEDKYQTVKHGINRHTAQKFRKYILH